MANKSPDIRKTNKLFVLSQTLDDADTLDIDPSTDDLDDIIVHNIAHDADCDVVLRVDSNANGTFDREVTIDSFSGNGVSQGNSVEVTTNQMMLRITDTSGGTGNEYIVTGEEV